MRDLRSFTAANIFATVSTALLAASCVRADPSTPPPLSHAPVYSTLGFSFHPPPGTDWTETFGTHLIEYLKKTDPLKVTFYTGVLEVKRDAPLPTGEALIAFVRTTKNQWGSDGRFTDISSTFLVEPQHKSCVRYQMRANDRGATNPALAAPRLLQVLGRFCTHPQNPNTAVDIYYSTRSVPGYDVTGLSAEGDAFLGSLAFHTPGTGPESGKQQSP